MHAITNVLDLMDIAFDLQLEPEAEVKFELSKSQKIELKQNGLKNSVLTVTYSLSEYKFRKLSNLEFLDEKKNPTSVMTYLNFEEVDKDLKRRRKEAEPIDIVKNLREVLADFM